MGKSKDKELKNILNQSVQAGSNPWEIHQKVQEHLQSRGLGYSTLGQDHKIESKPISVPEYDMNELMDKLGGKMPPGVKQMMVQFMSIIPTAGSSASPNLKKEMKKKMKGLSSVFKSPYE